MRPWSRRRLLGAGAAAVGLGALPVAMVRAAEPRFEDDPFTLGVASGYPGPHAVVLWTRLAPKPLAPGGGMPAAAVEVEWEVAEDPAFRGICRRGRAYATPDWAHSVHAEVAGLEPAREYWYRFTAGGAQSPIGRMRTAPASTASPASLRLAVASCQNYEQGYYAAFRAMANDDLDLIVHVGDYIYEQRGVQAVRSHDAPEAHTLEDYRHRYALYKLDPDLQAAHAACAWMVTSDDHEVDNDYAAGRSEEGDVLDLFLARRAAAYRAYYEHMPVPRQMVPFGPHQRLHQGRRFGDLLELTMLDGRQYRSPQACGGRLVRPCEELNASERTMLGRRQEAWLAGRLGATRARWNLLAQQTLMTHFDQGGGDGESRYWMDGWNGYPAARARLLKSLTEQRVSNPVVLSGDIHAFLVTDLHARADALDSPIVATELVTSSISSAALPQSDFDRWLPRNPNVRFARSDYRGYLRLTLDSDRLHADLIAVDDPSTADSPTHLLAAFDVLHDRPGVVR